MMALWIIGGVLLLAGVAYLILPLLRERKWAADERAAADRAVYRDQLAELEADVAAGRIAEEDAASTKLEIERRILAVKDAGGSGRPLSPTFVAGLVALLVPMLTAALYIELGAPNVPAMPLAARADVTPPSIDSGAGVDENTPLDQLAVSLERKLRENPNDATGWALLARTYAEIRRFDRAAPAYAQAIALGTDDADTLMGHGEALVFLADGVVTAEAAGRFEQAVAKQPGHIGARYYLALGHLQRNRLQEASDGFRSIVADSPADAPWLPAVRERISQTARLMGLDDDSQMASADQSSPGAQPMRGPTREQMQAAQEMDAEDRQAMIRSMVDGLAERLEENPDDLQGWLRLGRARGVLGEWDKAAAAYDNALRLAPDDPQIAAQLADAKRRSVD